MGLKFYDLNKSVKKPVHEYCIQNQVSYLNIDSKNIRIRFFKVFFDEIITSLVKFLFISLITGNGFSMNGSKLAINWIVGFKKSLVIFLYQAEIN